MTTRLFATANRLGTTLQNVEKDFWVCLVLDVLFNGRDSSEPRLLFKGGTSLSKAYGLISRFSEDLDITVFREDIGQHVDIENMISLSGKQQRIRLDAIKKAEDEAGLPADDVVRNGGEKLLKSCQR